MSGTAGPNNTKYNDAFQMMPSSGKLFGNLTRMASDLNVLANVDQADQEKMKKAGEENGGADVKE